MKIKTEYCKRNLIALKFATCLIVCFSWVTQLNAQNDSLSYHFYAMDENYGIFQVWNKTDTSTVVGFSEESGDSIYFSEIQGKLITLQGISGSNTTPKENVITPDYIKPNSIASKFHYLGGPGNLVHLDDFSYNLNNEKLIEYSSDDISDTMHYVPYTTDPYRFIIIQDEKIKADTIFFENLLMFGSRRKRKKYFEEIDYWQFDYDVYYSIRKFDFDLPELVGDKLQIGRQEHVIIFEME